MKLFCEKSLKVIFTLVLTAALFQGRSQDIIISEIMYNPPESGVDSLEYVELYNNTSNVIDLTGYSFKMGFTYVFPAVNFQPNDFIVVGVDSLAILNTLGFSAYQWTTGSLSNGGESVVIADNNGNTIDSLRYDDVSPWPIGPPSPDGAGSSITLCGYGLDNKVGSNWKISTKATGVIVNAKSIFCSLGAEELCCDATTSSLTETACDLYVLNQKTFTESGTYKDTVPNAAGCDSVITLNLTILKSTSSDMTKMACDSFMFGNILRTASGMYKDTIKNDAGCDSVITLNLTINKSTSSTVTKTSCDSYQFGDKLLTASGTYFDTIPNKQNCDSIITLNLTINKADTAVTQEGSTLVAKATNATFDWLICNGTTYTSTGVKTKEYKVNYDGSYAVKIEQNTCVDTSSCINMVVTKMSSLKFSNLITTYPNPSKGKVNLDLGNDYDNVQIHVIDGKGQTVWSNQFKTLRKTQINIAGAAGVYYLKVTSNNSLKAKIKVLKE